MNNISLRKDMKPLTNLDLDELVKELKIKHFRGVFMRDALPDEIYSQEVGIVNLDSSNNKGTHWVCYKKMKEKSYYFDSFGLDPPYEVIKYLKNNGKEDNIIECSTFQIQDFGTHICGYYCLLVLKMLETGEYMRKILAICLSLATHLHAGSTRSTPSTSTTAAPVDSTHVFASATTPSSPFDMNIELEKIATTCLTNREHELLSGDILRHRLARTVNVNLVLEAQEVIGLAELRDVLGFAPLGPWTKYLEPSNEEIAAASTIEAYYTLREPQSEMRSLDSQFFYEKSFPPAIAFLDKRIPAIRTIYRYKFAEIRRSRDSQGTIDRKKVDHMIDEFITISLRIRDAFSVWKPCKLLANQ